MAREKCRNIFTVEGGVVSLHLIAPHTEIIVRDYDIESFDEDELKTDEEGNLYHETIYERGA